MIEAWTRPCIIVNVVGWIGMALLISAYALVTTGRILGPSLTFQLMNLVGGGSLMVNSAYYGAWPSAALNLVWVVIGVVRPGRSRPSPATPCLQARHRGVDAASTR